MRACPAGGGVRARFFRHHTAAAQFGSPDQQRDLDARQALLDVKQIIKAVSASTAALICVSCGTSGQESAPRRNCSQSRTFDSGSRAAILREIRIAARQHQPGIAARREAEEADPGGIDHRPVFPPVQDEVEQANHVRRTRSEKGEGVAPRQVVAIVAGMVDRRDDEAGSASASAVSLCWPNHPPGPWEKITSGSLVPVTAQSLTPVSPTSTGASSLPSAICFGSPAQGYQMAPVSFGLESRVAGCRPPVRARPDNTV